jgi:hypothetical protein
MRTQIFCRATLSCVGLLALSAASVAAPVITVGHHTLLADTPNQQVSILVSGAEPVQGVNLLVQLGDGGAALGGAAGASPRIQDVSVTTGTIFGANNNGRAFDEAPADQLWQVHTATAAGTVSTDGVLAVVTVDTTGFAAGTFPLLLADIGGDATLDSDFAGVPAAITNGSITIVVPEPATFGLIAIALSACVGRQRRTTRTV